MRRTVGVAAALALAVTGISVPSTAQARPAGADPVVTWNANAQESIYEVARQGPYVAARSFAIVQGAVYDAVNAIAGRPYEPYLVAPRARRTDSVDAAVATAATRTLRWLFPDQAAAIDGRYAAALAGIADGRAKRGGIEVGAGAAAAMITARTGDGAFGPQTYNVSTEPGQWRPTPPGYAQDGAWVADLKPFAIARTDQFRTAGPPPLTSAAYAKDLNEIKALGSVDSTVRTPDQTRSAIWWHDRRLAEWEIKRQIAGTQHLNPLQAARMFAMADIANADSLIACFNEKRYWNNWRPVTAVREADLDGNPATSADPAWTPLLITPPFPDYTSGHTCSTAAIMAALRAFFGRDDIGFSAYSADSGTVRSFPSFTAALDEVVEARIWGGVHFRAADVDGAAIGKGVARYVLAREFRRTGR
jgi:hypothetical protein